MEMGGQDQRRRTITWIRSRPAGAGGQLQSGQLEIDSQGHHRTGMRVAHLSITATSTPPPP